VRIAAFHREVPALCGALADERRIVADDEGGHPVKLERDDAGSRDFS
jgi:hypothetical protein